MINLFLKKRSVFCRMVHLVAMEMLPEERDRKYYQERYTCCPPPFFIICVTLLEVILLSSLSYISATEPPSIQFVSATDNTIVKNIYFMQPLLDINLLYNTVPKAYKVITFYVPSAASIPAPVTSVN